MLKKIHRFIILKDTNIYLCAKFQHLRNPCEKDSMGDVDHYGCSYQSQEGLAYGQIRDNNFAVQMVLCIKKSNETEIIDLGW